VVQLIRQRLAAAVDPSLTTGIENPIPGLYGFSRSQEEDKKVLFAEVTLRWSYGQVEGLMNRLKLIKRQKYERAHLDLLRLRVLTYSGP
jgi:transposase